MYRKLALVLILLLCIIHQVSASGISISVTPDEAYVTPTFSSVSDKDVALFTVAIQNYYNYTKNVNIYAYSSPQVNLNWTHKVANVPAYGVATIVLAAYSGSEGKYDISIVASTTDDMVSTSCKLIVQEFDYASETAISGSGFFTLSKKVFDMDAAVNSESRVVSNGEIHGFVKNDYLIRNPVDKIPNFKKYSAVSSFNGYNNTLVEQEKFLHSFAFGGTGAKIEEYFDVNSMEGRLEKIEAHTDNILDAKTEFTTADSFHGYFELNARQSLPGKGTYGDFDAMFGNYSYYKHLVFKKD